MQHSANVQEKSPLEITPCKRYVSAELADFGVVDGAGKASSSMSSDKLFKSVYRTFKRYLRHAKKNPALHGAVMSPRG